MHSVRRIALLCAISAFCAPQGAVAGAWTQDAGQWLIISSFDVSRAGEGFDAHSRPDAPVKFDKTFAKTLVEYGWTDKVTLFLAPEFVNAAFVWANNAPQVAHDMSVEAGVRVRLSDAFGIVSAQGSFESAGAFDLSNSVGRASALIAELRLLDGFNFKLLGRDGFADFEVAQRWITHPRPGETAFDATAGIWIASKTMAMLQSFNTISGGDAEPPFTYYRAHKVELSLVQRISTHWSVQIGAYASPAGQNSLVEQGVAIAAWNRF